MTNLCFVTLRLKRFMGAIVPVSQQIKKISFLPYFSERRDSVLSPQRKEIQISNHFKKNRIRHLCAVQYGVALDQAFSPDPTDCPWVSEDGEAWVGRLGYSTKFYTGRLGQDFASLLTAVNTICFKYE